MKCFFALSKGVPIATFLDQEEQERISVIEKISVLLQELGISFQEVTRIRRNWRHSASLHTVEAASERLGAGEIDRKTFLQMAFGVKCEHGRQKSQCVDCGGAGICEHGIRRYICVDCGGAGICEHGRQKSKCKECGGSAMCEHGRQKHQCRDCGGSGICEHERQRFFCKDCGGKGICEHNKRKYSCKDCLGPGSKK